MLEAITGHSIQFTKDLKSQRAVPNAYALVVLIEVQRASDVFPLLHSNLVTRIDFEGYEAPVLCNEIAAKGRHAREIDEETHNDRSLPLNTSRLSYAGKLGRYAMNPPIGGLRPHCIFSIGVLLLHVQLLGSAFQHDLFGWPALCLLQQTLNVALL